jgi:hypothetical protein
MDDRTVGDGTTTLSDPPPRSLLSYGPLASRHSFGDTGLARRGRAERSIGHEPGSGGRLRRRPADGDGQRRGPGGRGGRRDIRQRRRDAHDRRGLSRAAGPGSTRLISSSAGGTFNVLRLAADAMRARASRLAPASAGRNTASIAAFDGQIPFSASEGGIVGVTLPVARDLATSGIRVCTSHRASLRPHCSVGYRTRPANRSARRSRSPRASASPTSARAPTHIVENEKLNGEVIRLDGALRMPPK